MSASDPASLSSSPAQSSPAQSPPVWSTPVWSPPEELPDHPYRFVPVPRRRGRVDGWSSDRQHAFVWALAMLPSITKAAASVGMSARSAYRLREAPGAEAFAAAWDDAVTIGIDRARSAGLERAIEGVVVPIVRRGVVIGERRRFNDRLLGAVLGNVAMENKGLHAHARRVAYRTQVRAADARLGGPCGADDIACRMTDAEAAVEAAREQARVEALANAVRPIYPPRAMIGVTRL